MNVPAELLFEMAKFYAGRVSNRIAAIWAIGNALVNQPRHSRSQNATQLNSQVEVISLFPCHMLCASCEDTIGGANQDPGGLRVHQFDFSPPFQWRRK
jgi:hypothetical protein